ncbi:MAG: hypothetical protein ACTSP5_15105 [Candidatus Heimdallarchaeota archaeon]
MSEKIIERGQVVKLDRVEGNLKIGRDATLVAENGTIVVTGSITASRDFFCEGNLVARNLRCKDGSVEINGDLEIEQYVNVDKSLSVNGHVISPEIICGGTFRVDTYVTSETIKIGGKMKVQGNVQAETVTVGGTLKIRGESDIGTIAVGGVVKLSEKVDIDLIKVGGSVSVLTGTIDTVDVGGVFKAIDKVEINVLSVGGSARFDEDSFVKEIDVGGVVKALGDLKFETIDVGGSVKIEGNAEGISFKVGGTASCNRKLVQVISILVERLMSQRLLPQIKLA